MVGVGTELTHPFQIPVGDVQAMKILQSSCGIYQLWKSVIPALVDANVGTYKLDSIRFFMVLDEIVDIAVIHPFGHQSKPGRPRVQCRTEQW